MLRRGGEAEGDVAEEMGRETGDAAARTAGTKREVT